MCTGHPPNCRSRFASTAAEHPQYARNQRHSNICFSSACTFSRCARESNHSAISCIWTRESNHGSIFYSISKCCCGVCLELILHNIRTGVDPQQDLRSEEHNAVAARLRDTFEGYQKRTAYFWLCFIACAISDVPHSRATAALRDAMLLWRWFGAHLRS